MTKLIGDCVDSDKIVDLTTRFISGERLEVINDLSKLDSSVCMYYCCFIFLGLIDYENHLNDSSIGMTFLDLLEQNHVRQRKRKTIH